MATNNGDFACDLKPLIGDVEMETLLLDAETTGDVQLCSADDTAGSQVALLYNSSGPPHHPSDPFHSLPPPPPDFCESGAADCTSQSDTSDAEKRMIVAITGALQLGPRGVVDAMWDAMPASDQKTHQFYYDECKRSDENLPLMTACATNRGLTVILKLMQEFPDNIRTKGLLRKRTHTALHLSASKLNALEVLNDFLHPEAARERDENGKMILPLHVALGFDKNEAVISELLNAYPEAARERDGDGHLPLRVALGSNKNEAVISELLNAYPEAARERDGDGYLPLVTALHHVSVAVISKLLNAYPEAARVQLEIQGSVYLPFHLALLADLCEAVTSELLQAYPFAALVDVVCPQNTHNRQPFHERIVSQSLSALTTVGDLSRLVLKNCRHPLYACIALSAALTSLSRKQRTSDIRMANDADARASELEQLACAIVRNRENANDALQRFMEQHNNGLIDSEFNDILEVAADSNLKFFISEPKCRTHIDGLWWGFLYPLAAFSGSTTFKAKHKLQLFFSYLMMSFCFASGCAFLYNFAIFYPPALRFFTNRLSYLAFLVFLLQLPLQVTPGDPLYSVRLELFLAYWLLDICFAEAVEFFAIKKRYNLSFFGTLAKYTEDPWNVYDVVALSTAVAAAFVRGSVHLGIGDATAAASNQLYAWALALLWGRLVNVLLIVSFLGPLLIMVLTMVFKDLSKFAFLVVLMVLPFVAALYFLESGNTDSEAFATFPASALSFFKIVIGQGPDIGSVTASSSILLSIGSVLLSVLLLNLLIAMFSKTFDTIVDHSTQEYFLQKSQITFTWARAPRMPPPLAIALSVRELVLGNFCIFLQSCCDREVTENCVPMRIEPAGAAFFDNKLHFYRIAFPKRTKVERILDPKIREENDIQFSKECDAKYEEWCEKVLVDLEENAEFNSEAQMDKFKSRMLRGMETTVESSSQMNHIVTNVQATQEQVKVLNAEIQQLKLQMLQIAEDAKTQQQQLHSSMQCILQKL